LALTSESETVVFSSKKLLNFIEKLLLS
jgi:hypothetical protein